MPYLHIEGYSILNDQLASKKEKLASLGYTTRVITEPVLKS